MTPDLLSISAVPGTLICAFISLCVCAAILGMLLKTGFAWRLATDIPNDRSLHTRPVPRVGGWGVVPAVVVTIWIAASALWFAALAAALLAILSQVDDRRGLPARVRFSGHVVAVGALIVAYPADVPWWMLVLLAFLLVWLVNLYNFMDGSDGLAGGMALFGFGAYAIAALTSVRPDLSLAFGCAAASGAAAGFLLFNVHPARIFLGDSGSIPLGFLAGALGYWGWRGGVWPVWFPAVVFSPFIGDASVTLLKRLIRREKFWEAHREHYYQRMVQSGFGHAWTARIWYVFMLAGAMLAVSALRFSTECQWLTVGAWSAALLLAGVWVDSRWRRYLSRFRQSQGSVQ